MRSGALALALACGACAHGGEAPPRDATRDPELQAALRRARPEFPRQRDALEAGVYETFVPPESVPPPAPDPSGADPAVSSIPGAEAVGGLRPEPTTGRPAPGEDPSTQELLASLEGAPGPPPVEAGLRRPPARRSEVQSDPPPAPRETAVAGSAATQPPAVAAAGSPVAYALQLGAFSGEAAAQARAREARGLAGTLPVEVRREGPLVRVLLGRFRTREEAEAVLRELALRGLGSAWITRVPR